MRLGFKDAIFLTLTAIGGAWLRLCGLRKPSLWLDEIYIVDLASKARHYPLWRWLIGFQPENGPLYFASELAGSFLPTPELAARFAPALFGIAAIGVAYFAAAPSSARYVFPLFIALSPLHVYYSREGRPYAAMMLMATALLAAMLHRARPRVVLALLLVTTYLAASSAPLLAAAFVAALIAYRGRERWLIAGGVLACLAFMRLLYGGSTVPVGEFGWSPLTAKSVRAILDSFSASAVDTSHMHRVAFVFLVLAVIGAVRMRERAIVLAFAILPAVIALTALWRLNHFFVIRYLSASLPGYLLLVASGVAATAELARKAAPAVAIVIALLLVRDGLTAAREEPFAKLDWRGIARTIGEHSRPGDQVVAANDWTMLSLGYYLREEHVPVHLLNAAGSREMALMFLSQHPQGWIVVAGVPVSPAVRDVACQFPLVRGDRLEAFRLHYVPSLDHLIVYRSTPGERRALLASYGGTIDLTFGPSDAPLLDSRWHDGEVKGDAAIALPFDAPADRQFVLEASAPSPQQLIVRLNDQLLSVFQLTAQRQTYRFDAPRSMWQPGANRLTASVTDARFHRLTVIVKGAPLPTLPSPAAHRIHLGEPSAHTAGALALPAHADRAKLALFTARLGFDPETTVPRLMRDELRPADLAVTLATDSVCLDDETFLRNAWLALLQREIDPPELAEYSRQLRAGTTREEVVRRMANSMFELRASSFVDR